MLTIQYNLARSLINFIVQLQSCDGQKSTDQHDNQRYQRDKTSDKLVKSITLI